MKKHYLIITVLFILSASFAMAGSTPDFEDGNWEITVKTEIVGMPMEMPAQTYTQCMTKKDFVPKGDAQQNQDCKVVNQKVSGNTVTWEMKCSGEGQQMTGSGSMTYTKTSFKGEIKVNSQGMQMVNKMSGRRLGPCKK